MIESEIFFSLHYFSSLFKCGSLSNLFKWLDYPAGWFLLSLENPVFLIVQHQPWITCTTSSPHFYHVTNLNQQLNHVLLSDLFVSVDSLKFTCTKILKSFFCINTGLLLAGNLEVQTYKYTLTSFSIDSSHSFLSHSIYLPPWVSFTFSISNTQANKHTRV